MEYNRESRVFNTENACLTTDPGSRKLYISGFSMRRVKGRYMNTEVSCCNIHRIAAFPTVVMAQTIYYSCAYIYLGKYKELLPSSFRERTTGQL